MICCELYERFVTLLWNNLSLYVCVFGVCDHGYVVLTCFVGLCHFWFPRPPYKLGHKKKKFQGNCVKRNTCNSIQCSGPRCQWHLYSSWNEDTHLNRHFVYTSEAPHRYAFPSRREAMMSKCACEWAPFWLSVRAYVCVCLHRPSEEGDGSEHEDPEDSC